MTLIPIAAALAAFLLCLLLSAFFSGSETATISVNRYRFRQLHEEGNEQAGKIVEFLGGTPRVITALLIGNNAVNVVAALLFKLILELQWPEWSEHRIGGFVHWSEAASILVLTPVIVIFAEVLPKALFRARADSLIVYLRPFIRIFMALFAPATATLEMLTRLFLRPFGDGKALRVHRITRRDVITLLNPPPRFEEEEGGEEDGERPAEPAAEAERPEEPTPIDTPSFMREPDERLLIRNIINLEQTVVAEIMQPLISLEAVHLGHITLEEFLEQARRSGYSRYPVYRYRIVNLIGYIDVYDVIRDERKDVTLESFVRPGFFVPETKRVDDLLQEFLDKRVKNAIVVDEYGGCCGWVSREDILEEIVGELEDELDLPEPLVHEQEEGCYLIDGRIGLDDLGEVIGEAFDQDYCDTLGGLLMKEMGRIPRVGEMIVLRGWRMEIKEMDGMRVKSALVRKADS